MKSSNLSEPVRTNLSSAFLPLEPETASLKMAATVAYEHHEKWNGSGYPNGLSGIDIPLSARILALGDVYDALTSVRCYKEAFNHTSSLEVIKQGADSHFDPDVVNAFLDKEDEFIRIRKELQDPDDITL